MENVRSGITLKAWRYVIVSQADSQTWRAFIAATNCVGPAANHAAVACKSKSPRARSTANARLASDSTAWSAAGHARINRRCRSSYSRFPFSPRCMPPRPPNHYVSDCAAPIAVFRSHLDQFPLRIRAAKKPLSQRIFCGRSADSRFVLVFVHAVSVHPVKLSVKAFSATRKLPKIFARIGV